MRLRDSRGRFKRKVFISFLRKARMSYREWKSSESLSRRLNKVGVWLEPDEPKFLKYFYEFNTLMSKGRVCTTAYVGKKVIFENYKNSNMI